MNQSFHSLSLSRRLCRLQFQTDGQYHQLEVSGHGCLPFLLPRLPRALFDWCEGLCAATWVRHQRCMAIMLLLDMQQREWDGQVPHQQSMPHGVCWQAGQRD